MGHSAAKALTTEGTEFHGGKPTEKRFPKARTSRAKTLSSSRGTAPTQAKRELECAAIQHPHSKFRKEREI